MMRKRYDFILNGGPYDGLEIEWKWDDNGIGRWGEENGVIILGRLNATYVTDGDRADFAGYSREDAERYMKAHPDRILPPDRLNFDLESD